MFDNQFSTLPGVSIDEMFFLNQSVTGLNEQQMRNFKMIYAGKRKTEQDVLLFSILGLCLIPGLQRFVTGQIGLGILYLFTVGIFFIGSIADLVNYKKLTLKYNKKAAFESYKMVRMGL